MKITDGQLRLSASDVANFLACQQLTQLDLRTARGERRPTRDFDIGFQDLVRRGEEHELTVLDLFLAQGHEVTDLTHQENPAATKAAIQVGPLPVCLELLGRPLDSDRRIRSNDLGV